MLCICLLTAIVPTHQERLAALCSNVFLSETPLSCIMIALCFNEGGSIEGVKQVWKQIENHTYFYKTFC